MEPNHALGVESSSMTTLLKECEADARTRSIEELQQWREHVQRNPYRTTDDLKNISVAIVCLIDRELERRNLIPVIDLVDTLSDVWQA